MKPAISLLILATACCAQIVPGLTTETVSGPSCNSGGTCTVLRSSGAGSFFPVEIPALRYHGQTVTVRAAIRTQLDAPGSARLMVRVHGPRDTTASGFINSTRKITCSAWSSYEAKVTVPTDAISIEYGVYIAGRGIAWVDGLALE